MKEETTITFGPNNDLVGTLCVPAKLAGRVGVLLLNAGVVHRVGPHRINVRIARRLAALGIASIRFDLAGQGDSERSTGSAGYQEQAVFDIRAAMDAFSEKAGMESFALFGFCSGAHHGFRAALADRRIVSLLIYDAFLYATFKSRVIHYYTRARLHGLAKVVAKRLQRVWTPGAKDPASDNQRVAFNTGLAKSEFADGAAILVDRGVRISMINSGSFEIYNYAGQFHDAFSGFAFSKAIETQFVHNLNHTATILVIQDDLISRIKRWAAELNPSQHG